MRRVRRRRVHYPRPSPHLLLFLLCHQEREGGLRLVLNERGGEWSRMQGGGGVFVAIGVQHRTVDQYEGYCKRLTWNKQRDHLKGYRERLNGYQQHKQLNQCQYYEHLVQHQRHKHLKRQWIWRWFHLSDLVGSGNLKGRVSLAVVSTWYSKWLTVTTPDCVLGNRSRRR